MPGSLRKLMRKLCLCGSRRDGPSDQPPPRIPPQHPSRRASRAPGPDHSTPKRPSTAIHRASTPIPRPPTPAPVLENTPRAAEIPEKGPDELEQAQAQAPPPPTENQFFAYVPDLAPTIRIVSQGSPTVPSPLVIDERSISGLAQSIADSASITSDTRPTTASSNAKTPISSSSESTLGYMLDDPPLRPLPLRLPPGKRPPAKAPSARTPLMAPNATPRPKTASRALSSPHSGQFWNPTYTTAEGWTSVASISRPQTRAH